jgi:hypothetical protein
LILFLSANIFCFSFPVSVAAIDFGFVCMEQDEWQVSGVDGSAE